MTPRFAAFLRLDGRPCVVVGGGPVATRKAEALLACGAQVRLVAPTASPAARALAATGRLCWHTRSYSQADLDGAFLVIAATDDARVNAQVAADARARRVLVARADGGDDGDFESGAVARRGDLQVAITTTGRAPAFAAWLRERIEALLDGYAPLFDLAADVRPSVTGDTSRVSGAAWHAALDAAALLLAAGDSAGARRTLLDRLQTPRGATASGAAVTPTTDTGG